MLGQFGNYQILIMLVLLLATAVLGWKWYTDRPRVQLADRVYDRVRQTLTEAGCSVSGDSVSCPGGKNFMGLGTNFTLEQATTKAMDVILSNLQGSSAGPPAPPPPPQQRPRRPPPQQGGMGGMGGMGAPPGAAMSSRMAGPMPDRPTFGHGGPPMPPQGGGGRDAPPLATGAQGGFQPASGFGGGGGANPHMAMTPEGTGIQTQKGPMMTEAPQYNPRP